MVKGTIKLESPATVPLGFFPHPLRDVIPPRDLRCAIRRSVILELIHATAFPRAFPGYLRTIALSLVALVPLVAVAHAGNRVWTGVSPRAKSVEAIVQDPLNTQRLWAATFGAGVY